MFKYKRKNHLPWGDVELEDKHYLLLFNEVKEFNRLTSPDVGFDFYKAFERLTGKTWDPDSMQDLKLVVEYLPSNNP